MSFLFSATTTKKQRQTIESLRHQQSDLLRKLELAQASTAAAERSLRAQCDEARDLADQQGSAARSAQRAVKNKCSFLGNRFLVFFLSFFLSSLI